MAGASGALVITGATGSLRIVDWVGCTDSRSPGGAMSPEHPPAMSAVVNTNPAETSDRRRELDTQDNMDCSDTTQNFNSNSHTTVKEG